MDDSDLFLLSSGVRPPAGGVQLSLGLIAWIKFFVADLQSVS